jgi:hypothetical protein
MVVIGAIPCTGPDCHNFLTILSRAGISYLSLFLSTIHRVLHPWFQS